MKERLQSDQAFEKKEKTSAAAAGIMVMMVESTGADCRRLLGLLNVLQHADVR